MSLWVPVLNMAPNNRIHTGQARANIHISTLYNSDSISYIIVSPPRDWCFNKECKLKHIIMLH